MIEQRDEDRRHRRKVGRPVVAQRRQQHLDVVLRDQDLPRAQPRAAHQADGEAVDVKVRDHEQEALVAALDAAGVPELGLDDVGEDVVVRQHRRLRHAGRAAGVLQHRHVLVRIDRHARQIDDLGFGEEIGETDGAADCRRGRRRRRVLRKRGNDEGFESRARSAARNARRQRVERQHHPHARVAQDERDLRRRVGGIDVHDDGAEAQHGEHRDQVLRTVRQHDADAIALHDAVTGQRGRQPIGAVFDLAERQVGAEKRGRRQVRTLGG